MKYQPSDIVVIWTKAPAWKWRYLKPWKFFEKYIWAWLVKRVSGPIHVSMLSNHSDFLDGGARMWDVPAPRKPFHSNGVPNSPRQPLWYWAHEIAIYRSLNWTDTQRDCMRDAWVEADTRGIRYGHVRNVAHFLDWVLGLFGLFEVFLFRRIFKGGPTWGRECSNHVANRVWVCAGQDFGMSQDAADPGDIDRFCRESGKYRTVLARTNQWRNQ